MSGYLRGADSVNVNALPSGLDWYGGYVGGFWPTFSPECQRFPELAAKGRIVPIAVNASEDARILDCERGDAIPSQCGPWLKRQLARGVKLPGIYAAQSDMSAVIANIRVTGVPFDQIVLWVAWWNGREDVPTPYKAHQLWDKGPHGENYDQNVALPSFFPGTGETHVNKVHYEWFTRVRLFGKVVDEGWTVRQYDKYRAQITKTHQPYLIRARLLGLRLLCGRLAKRIDKLANKNGRKNYKQYHRGYRRFQLWARYQGHRIV